MPSPKLPKKLIEVALPLDDINTAAAREKSIRHGHPSTLHLWWARRPLAAARAVLFAQLVNDPGGSRGYGPGLTKAQAQEKREELFDILRELVKWENTTNETVLARARAAIRASWEETCKITGDDPAVMPPFHDPFAGGGAIPLEAQRLGLEAHASDLNPVAVLINKAMIEIPPRFAGRAPVGPLPKGERQTAMPTTWPGASGLAEDVRRYGAWMRERAKEQIGHLYPNVALPKEHGGGTGTVIAWLWARTVASPNPALGGAHVPLVSSFWLSTKAGKEAWVEPVVQGNTYRFEVRTGTPPDPESVSSGTKLGRGANFRCVLSGVAIPGDYVKAEGKAGRMGARLMAIVAEGKRSRIYLAPTEEHERAAEQAEPTWVPDQPMPENPRWFSPPDYGLPLYSDLFTPRQTVALTTFSDLVGEVRAKATEDATHAGMEDDGIPLAKGGVGAMAFGDAVAQYLAFGVSKLADGLSSLVLWSPTRDQTKNTFARQALPMTWDFAEVNTFAGAAGDIATSLGNIVKAIGSAYCSGFIGTARQQDAQTLDGPPRIWSTDPPYYDNIGYADLSDFFYVWLRRSLRRVYPDLFGSMLVPKAEELVATPYRHGGKPQAERFFLDGMTEAMHRMAETSHPAFPVTIYYAFKQSDTSANGTASTGWETFLEAVLRAGFAVTGTWPMRTERAARSVGIDTNALASSIILVCRARPANAPTVERRDFLRDLEATLPDALDEMIGGGGGRSPIAPVDLSQAVIGPGIGVFSSYAAVVQADGTRMPVREALQLINREVDRYFTQAEGEMDAETRFCIDWFTQMGYKADAFGQADVLARAKGTAVERLDAAGVLDSGGGKVRLLRPNEYPSAWDPANDRLTPVWEALHQLVRALGESEASAGTLLARMPEKQEAVRRLAYRMYTLCERTGRAEEARAYNGLIGSWHGVVEQAAQTPIGKQGALDL